MVRLDESKRHGSVGRISEMMEAKIVDPGTGEALPPGQQGELWLRGPTIMKGTAYRASLCWCFCWHTSSIFIPSG